MSMLQKISRLVVTTGTRYMPPCAVAALPPITTKVSTVVVGSNNLWMHPVAVTISRSCRYHSRGIATATIPLQEKKTMKVPGMGDSITEGTIVEWTAEIGQAVKDGDVVAMVETDKVTIEIKAEMDGVVTQHFGDVDETVEVGANLYELDTEGVAQSIVEKSAEKQTESEPEVKAGESESKSAPSEKTSSSSSSSECSHRAPSIKFLGKQGWEAVRKGESPSSSSSSASQKSSSPHAVTTVVDDTLMHPMYGRPPFTDEEMEALILGGASIAPTVVSSSNGAKFQAY